MDALRTWLIDRLAQIRKIPPESVDVRERFSRYGLDSMAMTRLIVELSTKLGRPLAPTLGWEYPNIEALARHLAGEAAGESSSALPCGSARGRNEEPIAIIGMACRLPKAPNVATFWRLLCEGGDAITEVPAGRWDVGSLYDADPTAVGKLNTRWGGFLEQIDRFDAPFFGISPREAAQMDPQQRLILELAWEALEDAGIPPVSLKDSRTGVFIGAMWNDYARLPADRLGAINSHTATGQDLSIIPARVSYTLGLRGPSVALNTACSSSLVAVHYACRSLALGECELALVGGVNLLVSPESTVVMSKFGAMAPDGRSKAFDARANGYVRGEGGGMVVLKPLSRALIDNDPICCVILGSAVNNDGFSNGLTAPSPKAQELVLREAYANASVDVSSVYYIETHGTGTMLGDPIEACAIGAALGTSRPAEHPLLLGAVKTNIGHLESAAGIAGLIKAALALQHRVVPPNLHFRQPNPHIPFEALRLKVPTSLEPWPECHSRPLAGVSSFGFGGTNCHVVLGGEDNNAARLQQLVAQHRLQAAASGEAGAGPPKPVFVFAGHGSQWLRMGVDLLREPVFHAAIERCDRAMRPHLQGSIIDVLMQYQAAWLDDTSYTQPAIFAIQIALAALVRSLGVEPAAVIGQSMGEIAAAHVAGCLTLNAAALIICARSRLVRRAAGRGGMAVVELPMAEARQAISGLGDRISIAVNSSPSSTVLSGNLSDLDMLLTELGRRNVTCRRVKVDYASHSPEMDPILPSLREALASVRPRRGSVPFYSTVTANCLDGAALDAAYWCQNLREPVLFAETVACLIGQSHVHFLELDPHPLLTHSIEQCLAHIGKVGCALPAMRRDEAGSAVLAEALGVLGVPEKATDANELVRSILLPLSAHVHEALRERAREFAEFLRQSGRLSLSDICYSASARRSHLEHRLAVIGQSGEELALTLEAYARGEALPGLVEGKAANITPKVVFVFPGQGSQWQGMARTLLQEEPAFQDTISACDAAIRCEAGFSVLEELGKDEEHSRLGEIDVVQPVLFSVEVALSALWRSWGIEPSAVVGHSMGEIAAAHVAGALSLPDAAAVICRRSRLLRTVSGRGAMALVELSMAEAEKRLEGHADRLSVAVSNGPHSTVIAGDPGALDELLAQLASEQVFCRRVNVDVASHSPQMDPLRVDLMEELRALSPMAASVPIYSTMTGAQLRGDELSSGYWADNLRKPVLFSPVIQKLIDQGHTLFLEVSPHPILGFSVEENLREKGVLGAAIGSLRRQVDERRSLLESLASLYVHGYEVQWKRLYPEGGRVVALPSYPWQRERFWVEGAVAGRGPEGRAPVRRPEGGAHPLLGAMMRSSKHEDEQMWEQRLSLKTLPYLAEHRVQQEAVFPAAGYVEMALAAAVAALGTGELVLEEVAFEQMLRLGQDDERLVQVVLSEQGKGRYSFQIASRGEESPNWTRHVSGVLGAGGGQGKQQAGRQSPESWKKRLGPAVTAAEHYEGMRARQLEYGPAFQGVLEMWTGPGEAMARVTLPAGVSDQEYTVHPALLDACLQVVGGLMPAGQRKETYVPVGINRLTMHTRPGRQVWVIAKQRENEGVGPGEICCELEIVDDQGRTQIEIQGLRARRLEGVDVHQEDELERCLYQVVWRKVEVAPQVTMPKGGRWLVLTDKGGVGEGLMAKLSQRGQRCVKVVAAEAYERIGENEYGIAVAKPEDYRRLMREALGEQEKCEGVVHLLSLDATKIAETTKERLEQDLVRGSVSAAYLTQAIVRHGFRNAPRLMLVTRGAQAVGAEEEVAVEQAPLLGLGKTIALEHPELRCTRIDLAASADEAEPALLDRELGATDREDQIALRPDGRYVARIVRSQFGAATTVDENRQLEPAGGRPFRLEIRRPGVLDHLRLHEMQPMQPGPDEVVIEVVMAGLNFRDVMLALGMLPDDAPGANQDGPRLGGECAGTVVAVGESVTELAPGQPVIAFATRAFGSYAKAHRALCVRKPAPLSWEQAATLPTVFMTAMHALDEVGRLQKGERVLIHAGTGGVGLAALQWARYVGAEIFATAGSEEKRAYLRALGVGHVLDSRSLSFVGEVIRITQGEGVDVVLNSLSGEYIPASLSLLREHGRFVEIGLRDYYNNMQLGLRPFLRSLSFSLVDLRRQMANKPERIGAHLRTIVGLFETGVLKPLPVRAFPASQAVHAFQHMAQAKHIGKVALAMKDPEAKIIRERQDAAIGIRGDQTYLITGGLGGLGLPLSRWLVQQGARSLVLVGRNGPSEQAQRTVQSLQEAGAQVLVAQVDVSKRDDLARLLSTVDRTMPPLGGVIHAAAVLEDHTVLELDEASFRFVFAPKALGAWNLHALTQGRKLSFFVMYSSAAALLGSPGQGNYTAANALLDALSHERVRQGLPSISIQWGPFSEVGLAAAQDNRGNRLSQRGVASLTPAEGLLTLQRLLRWPRPEVGVVRFHLRQWIEFYPAAADFPQFAELFEQSTSELHDKEVTRIRKMLQEASPPEHLPIVERYLCEQLAAVLRLAPDRIDLNAPFKRLGMDSLMSIELRNRLEAGLGVRLSATLLFTYPNAAALCRQILVMLCVFNHADSVEKALDEVTNSRTAIRHDANRLSSDDLLHALAREIDDQ